MKPTPLTPADDGRVAPSIGTFEGALAEYLAERSNIPVYILEEGVKIAPPQLSPSARFRKALLDAARDECIRRFGYPVERYWQGEIGQRQHIERDAESTAGEKRFKSIFLAGWKTGMAEAKRQMDTDTAYLPVTPQDVADLELGRLVRKMPEEADLYRNGAIWVCAAGVAILGTGDTPEQAIRAALEESK